MNNKKSTTKGAKHYLMLEISSESILMGVCATSANTQTVRTRRLHDCQYTRVDCNLDIDILPHLALFLVIIYMISQWSTSSWIKTGLDVMQSHLLHMQDVFQLILGLIQKGSRSSSKASSRHAAVWKWLKCSFFFFGAFSALLVLSFFPIPWALFSHEPIPALISCAGVNGRWRLLSHAVWWLALSIWAFLCAAENCCYDLGNRNGYMLSNDQWATS